MQLRVYNGKTQKLIFRKSRRDSRTGKVIYARPGKAFPIWVDI